MHFHTSGYTLSISCASSLSFLVLCLSFTQNIDAGLCNYFIEIGIVPM